MSKEHDANMQMADILIVDDEVANLKLLYEILARAGHHVRPANSPRLAIESASDNPPDLVLLDVKMPDMDGFEVCELLKQNERTRDIPILFISALQETKNKVRGFEAGGVDFISKPFQEEEVLARIRTHLKLRTMQLHLEELVAERTAQLTKSEAKYRALVDDAPVGVFSMTRDGMLMFANGAMGRIFDFTKPEQMIAHGAIRDLVDPEDLDGMLHQIEQQGGVKNFTVDAKTCTGRAIYVLFSAKQIDNDIVAMAVDVTESRIAEQKLEKSEKLARVLLNATTDVTHLLDEDGIILDLNDAMAELLQGTREELLGTCVFDRFLPEVAEKRRGLNRRVFIEGKNFRFEDQSLSGNIFDSHIYPIKNSAGKTENVVIYAHDITELKLAERALKESEATLQQKVKQMRTIIDTMPAYIFAKDIDGRFLLANKAVADVFGVDDPEQVVGKTDLDYGATEEQARAYNLTNRSIIARQETFLIPEEQSWRKDGTLGWFQTVKAPYWHPGYDKPAVLGVSIEITDRKEAELALQESEARFRATFEQAAVGIAHVTPDGRFLRINQRFCDIIGYNSTEILEKKFAEIIHPDDLDAGVEQMRRLLREEIANFTMEKRYVRSDGEIVWCSLTVSALHEEADNVRWVVAVLQDITLRKQAERDLQRSRDYLDRLINSIPDAVFSVALPQRTLEWARDSYNVLGYNLSEYIGKTTEWLYPGIEEYQTIGNLIQNTILENRESFITELTVLNAKGESIPVEISATIFREKDEPVSAIGLMRDITYRKQTEKALKINEARLRKAQEIAHLGTWSWDMVKDRLTWSDEMYRIYGLDIGTPVSFDTLLDMVHPDDRKYREQLIADLINGKKVPPFSYRIIRPDGLIRYIYGMALLELDEHGNPSSLEGTLQDVTEMKSVEIAYRDSESRLKQAQTETLKLRLEMAHLNRIMTMNELAASFAHELNQPLGAIVNNAAVARTLSRRSALETADLIEILDDISGDAQRAGQVIRKIRGVVSKGGVVYTSLDVNQLLDEVITLYRNTFSLNHVSVVVEKDPGLIPVKGDQIRLQQVLMNLITNSIDAMADSSQKTLIFKTLQSEKMVKVSISDTGTGIGHNYFDQIFDPFYTTKSNGMGIGLRLCKSIIEEHGGRIWAENNRDSGATFFFTLRVFSEGSSYQPG